jgi:ABC-type multidrug transport system ATPase subunit
MKLNMTVKKTIQNNLKFLDLLGLSRELLKMKIKDLSYSQYKLVMLMQVCNMSPKVVILNNFDLGFNHKMKSKISKFIKTINANSKTKFIIITNDIFFINKNAKNIIIAKNKIIKYQGDIISAIKQNLIEKPEIIKFIDLANEKGANLDYTLDSRELLKAIYRSVF